MPTRNGVYEPIHNMIGKIFGKTIGRAEYTPPVIELVSFALEQGFALSIEQVTPTGNKGSFKNADRWYDPAEDKGVGNEYFKDDWTLN